MLKSVSLFLAWGLLLKFVMKTLLIIAILITGCATTNKPGVVALYDEIQRLQVNECSKYPLPLPLVSDDGYAENYRKTKQEKFALMINNVKSEISINGWSDKAVETVASWFRTNQVYDMGASQTKTMWTLNHVYHNGFRGDCKTLHHAFLSTLKYYLNCPYPMQIRIYNMVLDPAYHAVAVVNGVEYNLQRGAQIAIFGIAYARKEFLTINYWRK